MAANAILRRMSKCAVIFFAVAIAAALAGTPGSVALFTFTAPMTATMDLAVDVGTSVTVRCRVEYNATQRPPTVYLKKTFGNGTWLIATNDNIADLFAPLNRFTGSIIDNQQNGNDIYEWTITGLQLGDTGNYTCYTQTTYNSSSLSVSLNVTAEPTQLSLYINDEVQPQSMLPAVNKKALNIGQTYRIKCVATGSNPFPNVTLTSGTNVLPIDSTNMTTVRMNYVDAVAAVTRTKNISATWTMTNLNFGIAVKCTAGVKNPTAISNGFIPIAENALPNFVCPDQFDYDGKQAVLILTCKIFATDLSSYYVSWHNTTANMTVQGSKGVDIQAPRDSRYSLRVTAPQNDDTLWMMTLTINNANMIADLGKTSFHYVAIGNKGQAVHDVSIKSSMSGPISGGSLTVSPVGCLTLLMITIAMATLFSRQ
jgi:hypothetical protein